MDFTGKSKNNRRILKITPQTGPGTGVALLMGTAFMLAKPNVYADEVEETACEWAEELEKGRQDGMDYDQGRFATLSLTLAQQLSGGIKGIEQDIARKLLALGKEHTGDLRKDMKAAGEMMRSLGD